MSNEGAEANERIGVGGYERSTRTGKGRRGHGLARDRQTQAHERVHVVPERIELPRCRGVLGLEARDAGRLA